MPKIDKINVNNVAYDIVSGDNLPVNTVVDFDGQVADIPTGWEQVAGTTFEGYVLYENVNGDNGEVTVSDDLYNYDYVDIFFGSPSGKSIICHRVIVRNISGTFINLDRSGFYDNSDSSYCAVYFEYTQYSYANKKLTPTICLDANLTNNRSPQVANAVSNNSSIFKIIGYKEV